MYLYITNMYNKIYVMRPGAGAACAAEAGVAAAGASVHHAHAAGLRKHNSTGKREYARIMLPLMSQTWFHILGRG